MGKHRSSLWSKKDKLLRESDRPANIDSLLCAILDINRTLLNTHKTPQYNQTERNLLRLKEILTQEQLMSLGKSLFLQ